MLTKGIILDKISTNKYSVRIPILGTTSLGNTNVDSSIVESTICYAPGDYNNYINGDVVYIMFEDNQYDRPVILGKLYIGVEEQANNLIKCSSLEVLHDVDLPETTKIGDLTYKDIKSMYDYQQIINSKIDNLDFPTSSIYKKFTNVSLNSSAFEEDTTYIEFQYRATVMLPGVKSSDVINIDFAMAEAISGNYSPVCESFNGGVYFWSKTNVPIVIPTIEVFSS